MYAETPTAWRRWSAKLGAILHLAVSLHEGVRGSPDQWAAAAWVPPSRIRLPKDLPQEVPVIWPEGFDPHYEDDSLDILQKSASEQAMHLAEIVSRLAANSGLTPTVEWQQDERGGRYRLTLGSHPTAHLLGALVMGLIAVLTSGFGLFRCTECGNLGCSDTEGRRPRRDRSRFCGDECRDIARRRVRRESAQRTRRTRTGA
jgi:hypothetical protein